MEAVSAAIIGRPRERQLFTPGLPFPSSNDRQVSRPSRSLQAPEHFLKADSFSYATCSRHAAPKARVHQIRSRIIEVALASRKSKSSSRRSPLATARNCSIPI